MALAALAALAIAATLLAQAADKPRRHTVVKMALPLSYDVHWRVPVGCGFSGFFTEVVLGYLPALRARGVNMRLLSGKCEDDWLSHHLELGDANAVRAAWLDEEHLTTEQTAAALAIEHGEPCGMRRWASKDHPGRPWRVVARAMSEGALAPSNAQCLQEAADEIWVPTAWHVEAFVAAGVARPALHVVHEAVDTGFFSPDQPDVIAAKRARGAADPFTFFSVFKWEARKGWDLLLRAYWAEFAQEAKEKKVVLRLKTYLPSWEAGPPDLNDHVAGFASSEIKSDRSALAPVELHTEEATQAQMRKLYAQADAFVLPTRGEGWGLPICEAMAMALPAIATNFSGTTAYLTPSNSHPLPVAKLLPDGFAEPSVAALRRAMRRAYDEHGVAGERRGAQARADMLARFSREAVGEALHSKLRALDVTRRAMLARQQKAGRGARRKRGRGEVGGALSNGVEL